MSESVAETTEAPSQEVEGTEPDAPATDPVAEATEYKNRFAGSQRKLTETLNAKKALEQEIESLRQFKAQAERASMTEVERLKAEAEDARREAAAARAEAQRERLARTYPLAVEFYGDDPLPSEEKLATLNEKLTAKSEDAETAPEPRIDPNLPRRAAPRNAEPSLDDLKGQIEAMGNPFYSENAWR